LRTQLALNQEASQNMTTVRVSLTKSPNRIVATIFGAVYLLIGLLGFAFVGEVGFIAPQGGAIFGVFEVNPLHNVVHLLVGVALLIAGLSAIPAAKAANTTVGAVYLILGIVGFFLAADPDAAINFLALNTADHFLHLVSAVILLGVGIGADKAAKPHKLG
jgi:hypothetical protein